MTRAPARAACAAAFAGCPLVLAFVPERSLPAGLAYLAHDGWPLVAFATALALAACVAPAALASSPPRFATPRADDLDAKAHRRFSLALAAAGLLVVLAGVPVSRWNGEGFAGDEPKYLRLAESLLRDLDLDVASQTEAEWTAARFAGNLRRLARDTGDAVAGIAATDVPKDHRWSLGNWTIQGLHGGQYYVQSPGLPLLLLPALVLRELLPLDRPATTLPLLLLAVLWTFALVQTVELASEVSGSRPAGLAAGLGAAVSAPLLIGGLHFYPESAAAALVPWLLRRARAGASPPSHTSHSSTPRAIVTAALFGLGCGFLPWLHPKFLLTAIVLAALLTWHYRTKRAQLAIMLATAALTLAALLLFDHHVTGLLTPDAFYRRYAASVYKGPAAAFTSPMLLNGLVNALFGARDGIFVMAPLLLGGALAIGATWRADRRTTLELLAVFASLWIAAAVHEGGAPGPPGRLMAPVACVLAAFLAVGLVRLSSSVGYVLTVVTLAALTLVITAGMFGDWRRTNNPYREMFVTPERDFAKDLPDGPGRRDAPYETHKSRDRLRGLFLIGVLAAWSIWFAREGRQSDAQPPPIESRVAQWAAGFWITLASVALSLSALGP